jgi:sugar fermentation stimulation protein A
MVYVVQREDVDCFKAAQTIDPQYARLLLEAHQAGVEVYVYQCKLTEEGIEWKKELPWRQ